MLTAVLLLSMLPSLLLMLASIEGIKKEQGDTYKIAALGIFVVSLLSLFASVATIYVQNKS
jgi:hypothetical protein